MSFLGVNDMMPCWYQFLRITHSAVSWRAEVANSVPVQASCRPPPGCANPNPTRTGSDAAKRALQVRVCPVRPPRTRRRRGTPMLGTGTRGSSPGLRRCFTSPAKATRAGPSRPRHARREACQKYLYEMKNGSVHVAPADPPMTCSTNTRASIAPVVLVPEGSEVFLGAPIFRPSG